MSTNIVEQPAEHGVSPNSDAGFTIDETLAQAVQSGNIPGVVAMAATRDNVVYEGAYGQSGEEQSVQVSADSMFWIASMSKPITSIAAMQLLEQNKLQLDRPIGELLPELANPQVLEGFATDGRPLMRPAKGPITLRQLLTHTSGFGYAFGEAQLLKYVQKEAIPDVTTCTPNAFRLPLMFDPGERWHYGISLDWVGKVIEAASGQRLEEYFQQHIFGPLGMVDTTFAPTSERRERLMPMHARLPDGSLQPIPFELPEDPEFYLAGGGLFGTARDYLKLLQMILNEGTFNGLQILRPETVRLMAQNHIGDLQAGKMTSAMPELTQDVEFFPGMEKRWGLGYLINTEATPEGRSAGSLGWAGLANTYFWVDPARQVTGVIMTQILPFADPAMMEVFNQFEAGVYRQLDA
ncbi:serine hydrolase domain-containing protein [Halopseudomonas pelagia]|uniref:serine hydrolase domain-containing protein n=1 Tax=Halopseudomonas pelagia TaxID=553151 RepID=UPI001C535D8A|nr:serine hydrolase domain-containing protein [Halopseudomonas pelagia]